MKQTIQSIASQVAPLAFLACISPLVFRHQPAQAQPGSPDEAIARIAQIAGGSQIARYSWKNRGVAPKGYIKGMAVLYAKAYCRLKDEDRFVVAMAKKASPDASKDALAHYRAKFASHNMSNATSGSDTLRHVFVLLTGLGMRESSGRFWMGRDRSASNTTAETAEAGLFQTSFNSRNANPLLIQTYNRYALQNHPPSLIRVFREGVQPANPLDLENYGSGHGRQFQKMCKESPAFAAEYAAIALRNIRKHWGPITRREVEVVPDCDSLLKKIETTIETEHLCALLL